MLWFKLNVCGKFTIYLCFSCPQTARNKCVQSTIFIISSAILIGFCGKCVSMLLAGQTEILAVRTDVFKIQAPMLPMPANPVNASFDKEWNRLHVDNNLPVLVVGRIITKTFVICSYRDEILEMFVSLTWATVIVSIFICFLFLSFCSSKPFAVQ